MEKEEKNDPYVDSIIGGEIPKQDTYTYDDVRKIAITITSWCAEQIDHTAGELRRDKNEIEDFVAIADFKSIEDALEDTHDFIDSELLELRDFIFRHLG